MCGNGVDRRSFLRSCASSFVGMSSASAFLVSGRKAEAQYFPVLCSWAGANQLGAGLGPATPTAVGQVRAILQAIQFFAPIEVFMGGVPNAAASVVWGRPAVIYNPMFLNGLAACDPVAAVTVLAHEVGHHANQDTTWMGQYRHSWQRELGADWVSGLAMKRLGTPLERALSGITCSFGPFSPGSPSHPDSQSRIRAVSEGWYAG